MKTDSNVADSATTNNLEIKEDMFHSSRLDLNGDLSRTTQRVASTTSIEGQATFDFSQFAPLVSAFQQGEVEKVRLTQETNIAVAEMNAASHREFSKNSAARELRQDKYETLTTCLLFIACSSMMGYGMWAHDAGFITAGVSSFAAFLAGRRSGIKPKMQ